MKLKQARTMKLKQNGFTLIEVLVAVMILSGSIVVLSSAWGGNLLRIRKAEIQKNVAYLLERKMIELEQEYKDKPLDSIPETLSGDFGEDYPTYTWKMESLEPDLENVSLFKPTPGADGTTSDIENQAKSLLRFSLEQNFKEVKVSVIYTIGKKSVSFSITSLFISPKPQVPLGEIL